MTSSWNHQQKKQSKNREELFSDQLLAINYHKDANFVEHLKYFCQKSIVECCFLLYTIFIMFYSLLIIISITIVKKD